MLDNFKQLGLALLVLAAGASVFAASAAATTHDFKAEKEPYILTGVSNDVSFQFTNGALINCSSTFNKTLSKEEFRQELTLQPGYQNCVLSGTAASIDAPCSYSISGVTNNFGHAPVTLECPTPMQITLNGCTVKFGKLTQTPEQGATFTKTGIGSTEDLDIKFTLTNVIYEKVGLLCGAIAGLGGELALRGTYTAQAFEDKEKIEGAQVGFTIITTV